MEGKEKKIEEERKFLINEMVREDGKMWKGNFTVVRQGMIQ